MTKQIYTVAPLECPFMITGLDSPHKSAGPSLNKKKSPCLSPCVSVCVCVCVCVCEDLCPPVDRTQGSQNTGVPASDTSKWAWWGAGRGPPQLRATHTHTHTHTHRCLDGAGPGRQEHWRWFTSYTHSLKHVQSSAIAVALLPPCGRRRAHSWLDWSVVRATARPGHQAKCTLFPACPASAGGSTCCLYVPRPLWSRLVSRSRIWGTQAAVTHDSVGNQTESLEGENSACFTRALPSACNSSRVMTSSHLRTSKDWLLMTLKMTYITIL